MKKTFTITRPNVPRLPKSPAKRIDVLYELREARKKMQSQLKEAEKAVEALKRREDEIAAGIYQEMLKMDSTKMSGEIGTLTPDFDDVFTIKDWRAYHAHIQKTGDFDLLNRAPNRKALKARKANKKLPPGVEVDQKFIYYLTKRGKS